LQDFSVQSIDDIIITGKYFDEHMRNLQTVFDGLLLDPVIKSKRMVNPCIAQEVKQNFAIIAKPPHQVTEKHSKFQWNENC